MIFLTEKITLYREILFSFFAKESVFMFSLALDSPFKFRFVRSLPVALVKRLRFDN